MIGDPHSHVWAHCCLKQDIKPSEADLELGNISSDDFDSLVAELLQYEIIFDPSRDPVSLEDKKRVHRVMLSRHLNAAREKGITVQAITEHPQLTSRYNYPFPEYWEVFQEVSRKFPDMTVIFGLELNICPVNEQGMVFFDLSDICRQSWIEHSQHLPTLLARGRDPRRLLSSVYRKEGEAIDMLRAASILIVSAHSNAFLGIPELGIPSYTIKSTHDYLHILEKSVSLLHDLYVSLGDYSGKGRTPGLPDQQDKLLILGHPWRLAMEHNMLCASQSGEYENLETYMAQDPEAIKLIAQGNVRQYGTLVDMCQEFEIVLETNAEAVRTHKSDIHPFPGVEAGNTPLVQYSIRRAHRHGAGQIYIAVSSDSHAGIRAGEFQSTTITNTIPEISKTTSPLRRLGFSNLDQPTSL